MTSKTQLDFVGPTKNFHFYVAVLVIMLELENLVMVAFRQ